LSRQDGTKHKSSTLDKLPSRPASSPAGFLFAVEHRADRRYLPNGIGGIDAAPRFSRTKESDNLVANKAVASDGQSNRQSQTKQ
jgi:hypothetical protein